LTRDDLESALEKTTDWSHVDGIKNAEDADAFIVAGIIKALDVVAPLRAIRVKKGASDLYLARGTLNCIKKRDCARLAKDPKYRAFRNRATVLVAREKRRSKGDKLTKSKNEPKLLWQIANVALGKNRPTLPGSCDSSRKNSSRKQT
jgi:hypothetical protein